jgi:hypothetical protein
VRFRWVSVALAVAAGLGAAQPALAGGTTRTRTVSHNAQAVFFGGGCVVGVSLTESVERLLGSGKPVGAPRATMRVDTFCPEEMASATAVLGAADYAFTTESARVDATAGAWNVALSWQATSDPTTDVVRSSSSHIVLHDAPVELSGSLSDGTTTLGPEAAIMANLARVKTMARF